MKRKVLIFTSLLLLLALLAACSGGGGGKTGESDTDAPVGTGEAGTEPGKESETNEETSPTASGESTGETGDGTEEPGGNLPSAEVTWTAKGIRDSYTYEGTQLILNAVNCPVLNPTPGVKAEEINASLLAFCDAYVAVSSSDKAAAREDYNTAEEDGRDFELHEKAADFTVYLRENVISFLFTSTESSGGADSAVLYSALNFDLTTGAQLTLGDYLGKSSSFAESYIIDAFTALIKKNPSHFYDDALQLLPDVISDGNFYLTKDGLVLFLNTYAIAPNIEGTQTVTVSYASLPE